MILALHLFVREVMVLQVGREGIEVDIEDEAEDPGECTTYPVGFTRAEIPDEVGLPDRDY